MTPEISPDARPATISSGAGSPSVAKGEPGRPAKRASTEGAGFAAAALPGEDNADAHMKRQLRGREVVVAITDGKLDFGPWEQIFYGEFDGRRRKRALIKIIGE